MASKGDSEYSIASRKPQFDFNGITSLKGLTCGQEGRGPNTQQTLGADQTTTKRCVEAYVALLFLRAHSMTVQAKHLSLDLSLCMPNGSNATCTFPGPSIAGTR